MTNLHLCIHGHFYQPPRENPWTGNIDPQNSAHPFRDWNERISHECYEANTEACLLNAYKEVVSLANNYEDISFNFGPTLLSWLERKKPKAYAKILEADAKSVIARSGHGNALAQVYNHIIMPLASKEDKETEVVWGLKDFEHRFKRKAEGMWLSETAVNNETLELLASYGVKFTVLAPNQAWCIRRFKPSLGDWWDVSGSRIDPSRPYLWRSSTGASIALFFYDGPISKSVAFDGILSNGDNFFNRLFSGFSSKREGNQLIHIATDGESYGHHHRYGDITLAHTLQRIKQSNIKLTNYGEYLENNSPEWEVKIHENSSWSCSHGVERWRSNCGCKANGSSSWNQEWRWPLRDSLNKLAEELDSLFIKYGQLYFKNTIDARNGYIDLLLGKSVPDFLTQHCVGPLSESDVLKALSLLEMQFQRMLMFTSCAWFFDEISGIESTAVMTSAARAIHLASPYVEDLEKQFTNNLFRAKSNIHDLDNGAEVYYRYVKPQGVY